MLCSRSLFPKSSHHQASVRLLGCRRDLFQGSPQSSDLGSGIRQLGKQPSNWWLGRKTVLNRMGTVTHADDVLAMDYISSRNPPPGFQAWLKFAKQNQCHLGPYERIRKDLEVDPTLHTSKHRPNEALWEGDGLVLERPARFLRRTSKQPLGQVQGSYCSTLLCKGLSQLQAML